MDDLRYEIYHKTKVKVSNYQELAEQEPNHVHKTKVGTKFYEPKQQIDKIQREHMVN